MSPSGYAIIAINSCIHTFVRYDFRSLKLSRADAVADVALSMTVCLSAEQEDVVNITFYVFVSYAANSKGNQLYRRDTFTHAPRGLTLVISALFCLESQYLWVVSPHTEHFRLLMTNHNT